MLALPLLGLQPDPAGAAECLVPRLKEYQRLVRPVAPESMVRTHGPGHAMTPPPDPNVGDSWLWYTWKLAGFPVAEQKTCTVRGEGEHVYIVVEDSQWLTQVDQADVDRMLLMWDQQSIGDFPTQGIHELNTTHFGPVPDALDNDPKVYVLFYDFDVNADGFFWAFDQFPDGSQDFASNECETLYMNSSDSDPGGDYLISVQAHEFQHMIHFLADPNEEAWVDEGAGELAMWLFGHPDAVVLFPGNPDNNLTSWSGNFQDYVKTYLWTLYLYEHFGGQATILDLVSQPANSNAGVQAALTAQGYTETFAEVVRDWTIANWLDDPALGAPYDYAGETLPVFGSVTKSSYPVATTNASVNHFAADYIRFINGTPQRLFFDGADTSTWSVTTLWFSGGVPLALVPMTLDGADAGFVDLPQFGSAYDEVVMVVTNTSATGTTTYTYSTTAEPADVPSPPLPVLLAPRLQLSFLSENPSSEGPVDFEVDLAASSGSPLVGSVEISLELWDAGGRRIRAFTHLGAAGIASPIRWDGRDAAGREVRPGTYWIRAGIPGRVSDALRVVRTR